MSKPPAPMFAIPKPLSEKVRTRHFGTVTLTAAAPADIERIVGTVEKSKDADIPYRALVALCATGEHGERFTSELLSQLPGQCYVDWLDLRAAAVRVCGLSRENVGNT
ncbi:hypothetical protein [Paraburkholderia sp. MM5477-R1]|uniref:hypothetical protein n=1 Tax=Paraburkholderia sp. MM5477-R1 TaxID=2991062 RepID=UPI003D19F0E9